jgi:hypothetical protein
MVPGDVVLGAQMKYRAICAMKPIRNSDAWLLIRLYSRTTTGGRASLRIILPQKNSIPMSTAATESPTHWEAINPRNFLVSSSGASEAAMSMAPGRHHQKLSHLSRFSQWIHSRRGKE